MAEALLLFDLIVVLFFTIIGDDFVSGSVAFILGGILSGFVLMVIRAFYLLLNYRSN